MRILLLPPYFIPEQMASTHLDDNRYQAFADNDIYMICHTPTPTRGIDHIIRKEYCKRKFEMMYYGKMEVHRFSMYREGKNPMGRALRYILCFGIQLSKALFTKNIDLVYLVSTPPIQGVIGGLVKKMRKIPFVYNLQDIFPDSLVGTGLAKKDGFLWEIGRIIEDFTYRNADKIIVISEDFKRNIMSKGVPEEKIEVIYNWVDEGVVRDIPRIENKLFDKYNLDRNKFYITYCGNIGLTQNLDMLLEVAQSLEANEDIHFVLVGNGAYKEKVVNVIQERSIRNITLLPFQPYEDISHVFSLGDVSLVISKPGVGENSVPSKTWSILSASRPVLANFDENELKVIVEKYRCGIFTKAGDKVAFTDAILNLYKNRDLCIEYGRNGRNFILNNLTRSVATQKYVDVIKSFESTI